MMKHIEVTYYYFKRGYQKETQKLVRWDLLPLVSLVNYLNNKNWSIQEAN